MSERKESFLTNLRQLERGRGFAKNIKDEFREIKKEQFAFRNFLMEKHADKNRFSNVILYDHSRIRLWKELDDDTDYIHASCVEGYKRASAYILAQIPTKNTETDFWKMIWQRRCRTIVILEDTEDKFWPSVASGEVRTDEQGTNQIQVKPRAAHAGVDYDVHEICLRCCKTERTNPLKVNLIHYRKWRTDAQIPDGLTSFIGIVRFYYSQQSPDESPLAILCNTGVTRSGTFAVLDICIQRLNREQKVNFLETVKTVRTQRYGCLHLSSHYLFLNEALVKYAAEHGFLDGIQLNLATFSKEMKLDK